MSEIKRIRCGNVNCYLIEDHGKAILVDTGRNGFEEKILNQCRKTSVQLIVLTHGHVDHIQNTACLAKVLGAPVAMHENDLELLKNDFISPLSYQGMLGMVVAELSAKSYEKDKIPDFKPDIFLKQGENLKEFGINARVLELPGHTKGSIGLDIEKKDVVVGDALMNMFYPGLSMIYEDRAEMIKSAEKISALGVRKVYFGRGCPVENREWNKSEM